MARKKRPTPTTRQDAYRIRRASQVHDAATAAAADTAAPPPPALSIPPL